MEKPNYCPICEKHCPSEAILCGRGARYFRENDIAFMRVHDEEDEYDQHEHHEGIWDEDEDRPHRRSREPRENRGHVRHGREGREFRREEFFHRHDVPHGEGGRYPELPPHADPEDSHDELEGMIMACARKLLSHHGRRFGSTQDRIMRILLENGGTMNQRTLQALLHIQPGSISEILSKMEEKNLVVRKRDDSDRRAALITLKADPESSEKQAPASDDRLAMLTEDEKETLKGLLLKILKN